MTDEKIKTMKLTKTDIDKYCKNLGKEILLLKEKEGEMLEKLRKHLAEKGYTEEKIEKELKLAVQVNECLKMSLEHEVERRRVVLMYLKNLKIGDEDAGHAFAVSEGNFIGNVLSSHITPLDEGKGFFFIMELANQLVAQNLKVLEQKLLEKHRVKPPGMLKEAKDPKTDENLRNYLG